MLRLNLNSSAYLVPAGGYPVRLHQGGQTLAEGVIPSTVETVTAKIKCESGTCDAHLAIYAMPTTSGGTDGDVVEQEDSTGIGVNETTVTLTVPTDVAVTPYVFRLWVDNITGKTADTEDRDGDDSVTDEPAIPAGVLINSIKVA